MSSLPTPDHLLQFQRVQSVPSRLPLFGSFCLCPPAYCPYRVTFFCHPLVSAFGHVLLLLSFISLSLSLVLYQMRNIALSLSHLLLYLHFSAHNAHFHRLHISRSLFPLLFRGHNMYFHRPQQWLRNRPGIQSVRGIGGGSGRLYVQDKSERGAQRSQTRMSYRMTQGWIERWLSEAVIEVTILSRTTPPVATCKRCSSVSTFVRLLQSPTPISLSSSFPLHQFFSATIRPPALRRY